MLNKYLFEFLKSPNTDAINNDAKRYIKTIYCPVMEENDVVLDFGQWEKDLEFMKTYCR